MVYTCMHPNCGEEANLKSELLSHLKEKHNIEIDFNEAIPIKFGKLSYKCVYDNHKCAKKLDTINKIANHICKNHLSKTVMKFSNAPSNNHNENVDNLENNSSNPIQENTIHFNNIMIVSKINIIRNYWV